MERTIGSGRLSKKQQECVNRVTASGRRHPKWKKLYVIALSILLVWFYVLCFFRKYRILLLSTLLGVLLLGILLFGFCKELFWQGGGKATGEDERRLAQQQEQLKYLREEVCERKEQPEQTRAFIEVLVEENQDAVGWLTIPGTDIDYPVMQTPEEEDYYLYRDFFGNENGNGSLILAAACDVKKESTNWIIHGHNMKSGAMFHDLLNYRKPNYLKEHNLIVMETMEGKRTYEILSVFETQVYYENEDVFKFYQCSDIGSREEFESFYQNIKDLSLYEIDVTAIYGDHFITLSTCAYHTENGRFVVVGKEIY